MNEDRAFTAGDLACLAGLEEEISSGIPEGMAAACLDELWVKATALVHELATTLFGNDAATVAVWPWRDGTELYPFLWARIKAVGAEQFATHLGLFIHPSHCNLCIDLEKYLLDAGAAAESLDQVHGFYREQLCQALPDPILERLQVWTDTDNVVTLEELAQRDFDAFLAAGNDPAHPWLKIGTILQPAEVVSAGEGWVREYAHRMFPLVRLYREMLDTFGN